MIYTSGEWGHDIETLLAISEWNPAVPRKCPSQRLVMGIAEISFISLKNCWTKSRIAGDAMALKWRHCNDNAVW